MTSVAGGNNSKPPTASINNLRNASNSRAVQNSTKKKVPQGNFGSQNNVGMRSVPRKNEVVDIDWDAIEGDGQSVSGFNNNNNMGLITP